MELKTLEEVRIMREGGRMLREVMNRVGGHVKAGVILIELDQLAARLIKELGATPAFLGYQPEGALRPYPATICTSLNDVVVHGIPTKYVLNEGDVIKLDFGLRYKGLCVDAAETFVVGKVPAEVEKLIMATRKALDAAIKEVKPGAKLGDIGYAVQRTVEGARFKVVRGLTGHGLGRALHEDPAVENVGRPGKGLTLKEGLVIAIEPMTAIGTDQIISLDDDSYATKDGSIAAHFEHTVAVTKNGHEILTVL
jgi:methionyl aminopeptidase